MSSRPSPQLGFSFEYLMWIFTRISGLAMFLLAFIGTIGAFWMGARTQIDAGTLLRWTFFPNSFHVTNYVPDVNIWMNFYWSIMQTAIVFFGLTHGVNGLRVVLEDYLGRSWLRIFLRGLLFLFWLIVFLIALVLIWRTSAP